MRGLSLVVASGGHSSSRRAGLSPPRPHLLRSTGSRRAGSVTVAHGPSRSAACGILPDQGSNPCPLHWQADPQPLRHQGSPLFTTLMTDYISCAWKCTWNRARFSHLAVLSAAFSFPPSIPPTPIIHSCLHPLSQSPTLPCFILSASQTRCQQDRKSVV